MPLVRGGKHCLHDVKIRYLKFLNWEWSELLHLNKSSTKKTVHDSKGARRAAALRLVKWGELSRASRVLTSKGLAPASEDTTTKLASKHPSRVNDLDVPLTSQETINLSSSMLRNAIRRAPRGWGADVLSI